MISRPNLSLPLLILALFSPTAQAMPAARSPIYFSAAAKAGLGKAGSKDKTSVSSRTLLVPAVEAVLGFQLSYFVLGLSAEYSLWQQFTDPKKISDSNIQGKMFTLTPVLGINSGAFSLLVRHFPLVAKYDLSRPNVGGEVQAYSAGSQTGIQLGFLMSGHSFIGFEYVNTEFREREAGGKTYSLAAGNEMDFRSLGAMYVLKF